MGCSMSVSTRTRFEIFKRDGFRCIYCGATPMQSVLHVDHVLALANGGTDDPDNLVTACAGCNLGKAAVPLEKQRFAPQDPERIRDHAQQIAEYLSLQNDVIAAREAVTDRLVEHWETFIGPMAQSTYNFLRRLSAEWPFERLIEAMDITARKMGHPGLPYDWRDATSQGKYFGGILRRWRTEATS
jgi:hypothetical protein